MTVQPVTEADFWSSIEDAWSRVPAGDARARLLTTDPEARLAAFSDLDPHLPAFLAAMRAILMTYSSEQLAEWDKYCERALWTLDRLDVHDALDGSDDGFLYTRGFVVAAGKAYFDAVNKDPGEYGLMDCEVESMCYIACHVHSDRFGDWPPRTSGISRESMSNPEGWKE